MNKEKTIWIINQYAGSSVHGMEYRHYYLGKEWIKQGHQVVIISGSYSHLHKNQPTITGNYTVENIENMTYCWIKTPEYSKSISAGRFLNMMAFKRKLKKLPLNLLPNPDAIVVSSPSLFPLIQAHKFCKKFKAKLLFEVRDIWPLTLQEVGNLSKFHPLVIYMRYFEKYGYKHANHVVSLLSNAQSHMQNSGMKQEKFICISNGISTDNSHSNITLPEKICNQIPDNKFIIGYAGTLGTANALDYFVEAARTLQNNANIHFVIVGQGDQKHKLVQQAENLKNITFINAIQKELIPSVLKKFDVCYIGLKKEALFRFGVSPNKLFDYMMAEKPIIYSIDSGNKPVEEAKCGVTIEPENETALAEAIIQLFETDKNKLLQLGENGKKYVIDNHSYKVLAQKYISLF